MKKSRNEDGFSLIEMMIVLLIISVLILIAIPNVTKHSKSIDTKGCDAYLAMVQGQVEAYKMEELKYPTSLDALKDGEYFAETPQCPDGTKLKIVEGKVSKDAG